MRATAEARSHPHEFQGQVPDRLPAEIVRKLSVLQPRRAVAAIVVEWIGIAAAIALCEAVPNSLLYICAVLWIGARQHALTVLGHDVAHFRLFSDRRWNDVIGNLTTLWPTFLAAEGYRRFHGDHHRYIGTPKDGNRVIWATHTAEGDLTAEWTFPKTTAGLVFMIIRRAAFLTGIFWIFRGFAATVIFRPSWASVVARLAYYAAAVWIMAAAGVLWQFFLYWIVPYCTSHLGLQYIRLICEHSAVHSDNPDYAMTRTTVPRLWERVLVLPRNIHYHIEHHWYPSVPYYNLPSLHQQLIAQPGFRRSAVVTRSVLASLLQCAGPAIPQRRPT